MATQLVAGEATKVLSEEERQIIAQNLSGLTQFADAATEPEAV
jgi:hypothetical protein